MIHICDQNCLHVSSRDLETIKWIAQGKSNSEIARLQNRCLSTLKNRLVTLFDQLGASNRTGLVFAAVKAGLLSMEDL